MAAVRSEQRVIAHDFRYVATDVDRRTHEACRQTGIDEAEEEIKGER